jgi:hypothetical protein
VQIRTHFSFKPQNFTEKESGFSVVGNLDICNRSIDLNTYRVSVLDFSVSELTKANFFGLTAVHLRNKDRYLDVKNRTFTRLKNGHKRIFSMARKHIFLVTLRVQRTVAQEGAA